MIAEYTPNNAYPDNPFIEALPRYLFNDELAKRLTYIPAMPMNVHSLPAEERIGYTRKLFETFIPLGYAPTVYNIIYQGILASYREKGIVETAEQSSKIYTATESGLAPRTNAYANQALGASILGVSGMGKSTTINRILSSFPQVIEHRAYRGQPFYCHQITYIMIQCPSDCSVKAACLEILAQIDSVLSTSSSELTKPRKSETLDSMVVKIAQLCLTHHIGTIIIDEIQNILGSTNGGKDSKLIRFLVQLMNETGISILLVGTPEVSSLFDASAHLMRRTRGPRITPITDEETFVTLSKTLWDMQCVKKPEPITDGIINLLYDVSGGVPALLSQILCYSQESAIMSGEERLSAGLIMRTAAEHNMVRGKSGKTLSGKLLVSAQNISINSCKQKGRPKAKRESDDLLAALDNGEDIEKLLQSRNLCKGLSEC